MSIGKGRKYIVRCNTLLTKRYRSWLFNRSPKKPWFYCIAVTFLAIVCVLLIILSVSIEEEHHVQSYSNGFLLFFFAITSMLFGSRIVARTTVQMWHLLPYPLSSIQKYGLLLTVNLRDYRMILYAAITLTFAALFLPRNPWVSLSAILTCILFSVSIEIWLLNIQLLMSTLQNQNSTLLGVLWYLPFLIYAFISDSRLGYSQLLTKLPLTGWAGRALFSARAGEWAIYTLYACLLALAVIGGLLAGYSIVRRGAIRMVVLNKTHVYES